MMTRERTELAATFAANRARGAVMLSTRLVDGRSRRHQVAESGSLRVRCPSPETNALSAVLVNTAGGVAAGDRFDVSLHAGEGSALTLTTAAAEKIYRSQGLESEIGVSLCVDERASLNWLPQETILFDRARVSRRIDIELAKTASLLLAEIVVFGRAAMNERVEQGRFTDRWRVRRGGRLIFAETVRLDGAIREVLNQPAVAGGGCAIATVLIVPGDEALIACIREASGGFGGEVGVSAWNGFALARFCAADAARLRADVIAVLKAVNADILPRLWLN